MNEFVSLYQDSPPEQFLNEAVVSRLALGGCPFLEDAPLSGRHYVLVGRHTEGKSRSSVTITLGVKTTTDLYIEGGYLPVSEAYFRQVQGQLKVAKVIRTSSIVVILASLLVLVLFAIADLPLPEGMEWVTTWIGPLFLPALGTIQIASMMRRAIEKKLSRKTVKREGKQYQIPIPDYTNREMKVLLESGEAAEEMKIVRRRERRKKS